jgi:hypothetical protein
MQKFQFEAVCFNIPIDIWIIGNIEINIKNNRSINFLIGFMGYFYYELLY